MRSQATLKAQVIDVSKSWQRAWWATVLGVSEDTLLDAVTLVGNESDAVEEYLGIRKGLEQHHRPD
jgi:Protein of unknown function (DUF3606)